MRRLLTLSPSAHARSEKSGSTVSWVIYLPAFPPSPLILPEMPSARDETVRFKSEV